MLQTDLVEQPLQFTNLKLAKGPSESNLASAILPGLQQRQGDLLILHSTLEARPGRLLAQGGRISQPGLRVVLVLPLRIVGVLELAHPGKV
ncbi:hypothetical protein EVJ50_05540 [Synechococcus sp. RSCCF101]|uniref:hypothetical protein n=1 Tax=Synechococcus sp. RSCCF101 TaxID=2511069 RepID=UPI001243B89A|nr:hypothetical protein [Synechococcus sp. RSCCF101]QEY31793.1 hypothetical protein EVJ50_05540 [Synechococcus sp. RSCCF101]